MNPCPSEGKQRSLARCKVLSPRHSFAHAALAVLGETEALSLEELHGGVLCRHGAAIELSCALAIGGAVLGGTSRRCPLSSRCCHRAELRTCNRWRCPWRNFTAVSFVVTVLP